MQVLMRPVAIGACIAVLVPGTLFSRASTDSRGSYVSGGKRGNWGSSWACSIQLIRSAT